MGTAIALLLAGLLTSASAQATALLQLDPADGKVAGSPGQTVGWGFTLSNDAGFAVVTLARLVPTPDPAVGQFVDLISAQFAVVGPSPESTVWQQQFDLSLSTGLGAFVIAPGALPQSISAEVEVFFDLYDVSPNDPQNFDPDQVVTGNVLRAPVTIDILSETSQVPEPSTGALLLLALALTALLRARRGISMASVVLASAFLASPQMFAARIPGPAGKRISPPLINEMPRLTTFFEKNNGQLPPGVAFLGRSARSTVYLMQGSAIFYPTGRHKEPAHPITLRFHDKEKPFSAEGIEPTGGMVHHLMASGVMLHSPMFAGVRIRQAYPGIDIVFYARQGTIEWDFVVTPGADPNKIRFLIENGQGTLDESGRLEVRSNGSAAVISKPVSYQQTGRGKVPVLGGYQLVDGQTVSLKCERYDPSLPLIIDPTLEFSTYFGSGDGEEAVLSMAVDGAGFIYVGGMTSGTILVPGAPQNGALVHYMGKLAPDGQSLVFLTIINPGQWEQVFGTGGGLVLDDNARPTFVHFTSALTFPVVNATGVASPLSFAVKLTTDGSGVVFSKTFSDRLYLAQRDPAGNLYLAGDTVGSDVVVTKISSDASSVFYRFAFGSPSEDQVGGLAVDPQGNAVVTGYTFSTTGFPIKNPIQQTGQTFVSKINATGTDFVFSTLLHTSVFQSVATDPAGNIFVAVDSDAGFPLKNARLSGQLLPQGVVVLLRFDPIGNLQYATFLEGFLQFAHLRVDGNGNLYLTGWTWSPGYVGITNPFPDLICRSPAKLCVSGKDSARQRRGMGDLLSRGQ